MVTHGPNHYVGGTQYGRDFLEDNLHLPVLFLSDVQNSKLQCTYIVVNWADRKLMKICENGFTACYEYCLYV